MHDIVIPRLNEDVHMSFSTESEAEWSSLWSLASSLHERSYISSLFPCMITASTIIKFYLGE